MRLKTIPDPASALAAPPPADATGGRRLPGLGLLLALIGAGAFAWVWVGAAYALRPLITWADLFRYVQRYSLDPYYGMAIPERLLDYAISEYGWQMIVLAIFETGLSFETAFLALSMFAVGLTAYTIIRRTGGMIGLLLLIHPAQIDFFVSQVRSALAFSIVFAGLQRSLPVAIATILVASTIHTSMLLFAVPLALDLVRRRTGGHDKDAPATGHGWPIIAFITAALLSSLQVLILDFLGDRRALYADLDQSAGLLLTISWAIIGLAFYWLAGRRASLAGLAACFLIGMFVSASLLGYYSHRYAAFLAPLLAVAMAERATPRRNFTLFLLVYGLFSLAYFSFWL